MLVSKLSKEGVHVFEKKFAFTNKKTLTEERRLQKSLLSRSKLKRGTLLIIILYLRRQGKDKKIIIFSTTILLP